MKKATKTQLLDAAQQLVQTRGHNGFSFQHLSDAVGISTASIHYHFPTKTDLAVALVRRYREALGDALADIGIRHRWLAERLEAIIRLYTETLSQGSRICICAALAGEYLSLPRPLRSELQALMADGEKWIARVLTEGRCRGEITRDSPVPGLARLWYAALQGALLLSRADGPEILRDAAATLKALTLARPGSRVRRNLPINR